MITYEKIRRYKYINRAYYEIKIDSLHEKDVGNDYVSLSKDGTLRIAAGYAWDGPSGPTIDTKNFMEGSLVHDALYQLMRDGHISRSNQKYAGKLLVNICKSKGMSRFRAWYVLKTLKTLGHLSIKSPVITIQ